MPLAIAMLFFQLSFLPQTSFWPSAKPVASANQAASLTASANADASEPVSYSELPATLAPAPAANARLASAVEPLAPAKAAFVAPVISTTPQTSAEQRRKYEWLALVAFQSGAAAFDAATTRSVISGNRGVEDNPMLRPFAGNDSLYAAIQVGPVVMDYLGHWMMKSHNRWVRRAWWIPQAASGAVSIASGVHNLGVAGAR